MNFKPEISFGTRIRKSPFFESTMKWGCKGFTVYNKMYMPTYYKSFVDDYWSLVKDVTLWDVAGERQVEIKGNDAEKFVEYITPRDISECKVGQCMYVLLTEKDGGIVNDPVLLKLAQNHYWLSIADSDVLLWCKGIASSKHFEIELNEPDVSPLSLQGPQAPNVMENIVGSWARELKFFHFKNYHIQDIPVVIARSGWSGEKGYEIYLCDGKLGNELWEIIMKAGEEFNIAPASPSQISRIECGMLSYGSDMSIKENPYDVSLGRLVNLNKKADFLSRTALMEIKQQGNTRELVGIEILGEIFSDYTPDHLPIYIDEKIVGKTTSCVFSPQLNKTIGLALLNIKRNLKPKTITVNINNKVAEAKICKLPFLRNK